MFVFGSACCWPFFWGKAIQRNEPFGVRDFPLYLFSFLGITGLAVKLRELTLYVRELTVLDRTHQKNRSLCMGFVALFSVLTADDRRRVKRNLPYIVVALSTILPLILLFMPEHTFIGILVSTGLLVNLLYSVCVLEYAGSM